MSCAPCFDNALMNAVSRDLHGWNTEKLTEQSAALHLDASTRVTFSVRQKRLFMASIQSCEFSIEGALNRPLQGSLRARQSGWFTRQPVTFRAKRCGDAALLAAHLNTFPALQQTLSELDYRYFTLSLCGETWRCTLEPWAASEVVCRLPPLRRYLRLERHQRMLLLSVMGMISQAMARWERQATAA